MNTREFVGGMLFAIVCMVVGAKAVGYFMGVEHRIEQLERESFNRLVEHKRLQATVDDLMTDDGIAKSLDRITGGSGS
ncbi:MAG: hypothetical protein AAFV88_25035 [Planctomycetota bacterium]